MIIKKIIKKIKWIVMQFAYLKKNYNAPANYVNLSNEYNIDYKKTNELCVSITPVYLNKNGIITVMSDDADYHTVLKFCELSEKYSIPVTISGPVFNVYGKIRKWKSILAKGNLELVNHSYNHYRMSEDWIHANNKFILNHEINHSQQFFEKNFVSFPRYVFVCPHNIVCKKGLDLLKERGVIAMRGYGASFNNLEIKDGYGNGQWLNLNSFSIMDEPLEEKSRREMRNNWIKKASQGFWVIEQWHNIDTPGFQSMPFDDADEHFSDISEMSRELNIWNASFTDAVKYIKEKQEASSYSWIEDGKINIALIIKNKMLFDSYHELTVCLPFKDKQYFFNIIPNTVFRISIGDLK